MITFYGSPMSSAGRTHWMLEETGQAYTYHRLPHGGTRTSEFLAVHAGGKIPVIVDGDLVLGESMAIDFYLAERYAPTMWSTDVVERARIYEWSFWAITNLQPELLRRMMHTFFLPEPARDQAIVEAATAATKPLLAYLERALSSREHLVGERFTVADLHVGSVVNLAARQGMLGEHPRLDAWTAALRARPAYERAVAGA